MKMVMNTVQKRMGGGAAKEGGSKAGGAAGGKAGGGSGGGRKAGANEPGGGKAVITLTDDNFAATVLDSADPFIVEFYAPW